MDILSGKRGGLSDCARRGGAVVHTKRGIHKMPGKNSESNPESELSDIGEKSQGHDRSLHSGGLSGGEHISEVCSDDRGIHGPADQIDLKSDDPNDWGFDRRHS